MPGRRLEAMRLFNGHQSERVGEGKVGFRIGVQDGYAEAVFRLEADFTRAVRAGYDATANALL